MLWEQKLGTEVWHLRDKLKAASHWLSEVQLGSALFCSLLLLEMRPRWLCPRRFSRPGWHIASFWLAAQFFCHLQRGQFKSGVYRVTLCHCQSLTASLEQTDDCSHIGIASWEPHSIGPKHSVLKSVNTIYDMEILSQTWEVGEICRVFISVLFESMSYQFIQCRTIAEGRGSSWKWHLRRSLKALLSHADFRADDRDFIAMCALFCRVYLNFPQLHCMASIHRRTFCRV